MSKFILSIIFPIVVFAQDVHYLSLEKCLEIAQEESYSIRFLREDFKVAGFQLTAATNRFKTQVNLNLSAPIYSETISSFVDTSARTLYFPQKQAIYSSDLGITQPLPTDGRVFIQSGIFHIQDFSNNINSFRLNTRIGFEQPLEAIYSYNGILAELRNAELNYELQQRRLTRTLLDLNYEISSAFYNLLSAIESQKIASQTFKQQQESNELAQNKYKAGVIAEVEALQMEVDLAEASNSNDLAKARTTSQANQLKQLLGFALMDSIVLEADLGYEEIDVSLQTALELREREISEEQAEIDIRRTRVNGQITGILSAYYDFIGVNEEPEDIALSSNFSNAFKELQNRPGNRGVSLQLEIMPQNTDDMFARIQAAKARLRQAKMSIDEEKLNVERDIRNTVTNLKSSLKRLKLLEKNIKVAERSFEITRNRFANGEINSQALALDRNRLSQAYNSRLQALISYKLLLADITRKTFYDFVNKIEIKGSD